MKIFKNIGELIIIWVISIGVFSVFFSIYGASLLTKDPQFGLLGFIFVFVLILFFALIFSFICSLPAFVVFAAWGLAILQIPMHIRIKRMLILGVNYLGIGVTCAITFAMIAVTRETEGHLYPLHKYILWYPNWALVFSSTAAILLMPLGHKSPLLTTHKK
jgi:hypothetical protein